jgi:hypothetical protein
LDWFFFDLCSSFTGSLTGSFVQQQVLPLFYQQQQANWLFSSFCFGFSIFSATGGTWGNWAGTTLGLRSIFPT